MTTAVGVEAFEDFADIAGPSSSSSTTPPPPRDFANQVRWNQAYYRLAQGL